MADEPRWKESLTVLGVFRSRGLSIMLECCLELEA